MQVLVHAPLAACVCARVCAEEGKPPDAKNLSAEVKIDFNGGGAPVS